MILRRTLVAVALAIALPACSLKRKSAEQTPSPPPSDSSGPADAVTTLVVAYGSEKKTWLEEATSAFNAVKTKTASGKRIEVDGRVMGSGEAMQAILAGTLRPHVISPASSAYVSLLNRRWLSVAGHVKALSPAGEPIVLSPVVIATWKPMAEALGWPNKPLGWRDFLKVASNAEGWGAYGHAEWGPFKLGHTHPEYSNSGLLAVLAEAYAGSKKGRGLVVSDLESSPTLEFVGDVETSVVHYGKSTRFFFDKMVERGPPYLSAAVLYENLVIESYGKGTAPLPMVSVYPVEGTFWSDHPYAVLDAEWVDTEHRDAAQKFLAYLKERPRQERALALGFRPADPTIAVAAPIDALHGADPKQPQSSLEVPEGATLEALTTLFKRVKKHASVVFAFDKSKSMEGPPLAQAKAGAVAFLDALDDQDNVTLLFFDHKVHPAVGPFDLANHRKELVAHIDAVVASGGTSVYDATLKARDLVGNGGDGGRILAVVVMTDGQDEDSRHRLADVERAVRVQNGKAAVRVFTIAYGSLAEESELARIAEAGQGFTAKGDLSSIVEIYRDMASFF
jgi:Ca-activated chloride channel family protein